MLKLIRTCFEEWNRNNIEYCIIKGTGTLDARMEGKKELNVLLVPSDRQRAESSLAELGFRVFTGSSLQGERQGRVWTGLDEETGTLISLRLYEEVFIDGTQRDEYVFFFRDTVLNERRYSRKYGAYLNSPNLEVIISYVQLAMRYDPVKNPNIELEDLCEVSSHCREVSREEILCLCRMLFWGNGERIADTILELLQKEMTLLFSPSIERELISLKGKIQRELVAPYAPAAAYLKAGRSGRSPQTASGTGRGGAKGMEGPAVPANAEGISICFIGADGAGKTTLSRDIEEWLQGKLPCRKYYLGSADQVSHFSREVVSRMVWLVKQSKRIVRLPGPQQLEPGIALSQGTVVKRMPGIEGVRKGKGFDPAYPVDLLKAYRMAKAAERSFKAILEAEDYRKRGGIVLYDRFPQTQFQGIYDGPKIAERFKDHLHRDFFKQLAKTEAQALAEASAHTPSLVFKLVLPPDVSLARKPDHSPEIVRKKAEITEKLVFNNAQCHVIDATQRYEAELLEVKRIIWTTLGKPSSSNSTDFQEAERRL